MNWKRAAMPVVGAAWLSLGVACGPLPQSPAASVVSPYHGSLGGGTAYAGELIPNTVTFGGCAISAGVISVNLAQPAGGPEFPDAASYEVTIREPSGTETQDGTVYGDTVSSPHTLGRGECSRSRSQRP